MRINGLRSYQTTPISRDIKNSSVTFCKSKPATIETKKIEHTPIYYFFHHTASHKQITLKTLSGEKVSAELVKAKHDSWYIKKGEECLGTILISKCNAPIAGKNYPEYYKGKNYLFINSLSSHKTYKGVGTELVKAVVEESKRLGLGGRVCLNASTTNPSIGSPIPFYYKMGFESASLSKQQLIEKCMKKGIPLAADCESTTMFLPQDKINKLIDK